MDKTQTAQADKIRVSAGIVADAVIDAVVGRLHFLPPTEQTVMRYLSISVVAQMLVDSYLAGNAGKGDIQAKIQDALREMFDGVDAALIAKKQQQQARERQEAKQDAAAKAKAQREEALFLKRRQYAEALKVVGDWVAPDGK